MNTTELANKLKHKPNTHSDLSENKISGTLPPELFAIASIHGMYVILLKQMAPVLVMALNVLTHDYNRVLNDNVQLTGVIDPNIGNQKLLQRRLFILLLYILVFMLTN